MASDVRAIHRSWSMGWEKGKYYTRSRKVGGRVVREYVGTGQIGVLAAELDRCVGEQRDLERQMNEATRAELAALDEPLDELDDLVEALASVGLLMAGCRRHKRGEWRKKRGRRE
jgi:hypothetical protein